MKYVDVKAQKENYLVFFPTVPNGQNFHVVLLLDLSFLPCLLAPTLIHKTNLASLQSFLGIS